MPASKMPNIKKLNQIANELSCHFKLPKRKVKIVEIAPEGQDAEYDADNKEIVIYKKTLSKNIVIIIDTILHELVHAWRIKKNRPLVAHDEKWQIKAVKCGLPKAQAMRYFYQDKCGECLKNATREANNGDLKKWAEYVNAALWCEEEAMKEQQKEVEYYAELLNRDR